MILKCDVKFKGIYSIEHKRETKIILSAKKCLNKTLFTDTLKIFDFLVILGFAGIPRRPFKYRKFVIMQKEVRLPCVLSQKFRIERFYRFRKENFNFLRRQK